MNAINTINTTNKQSCPNKIALIEYAFVKVKNSKKRKDLKYDIIGLSSYTNQEFLEIGTCCNNPLQEFKNNIQKFVPDKNYTLLQNNIFDIIFYDASHKLEDILKFFIMYRKLIENSILIIDDYNFKSVQEAIEIIQSKKIIKIQKIFKVMTDAESRNDFWNGICVII